jgi:hypothetical protein
VQRQSRECNAKRKKGFMAELTSNNLFISWDFFITISFLSEHESDVFQRKNCIIKQIFTSLAREAHFDEETRRKFPFRDSRLFVLVRLCSFFNEDSEWRVKSKIMSMNSHRRTATPNTELNVNGQSESCSNNNRASRIEIRPICTAIFAANLYPNAPNRRENADFCSSHHKKANIEDNCECERSQFLI